MKNLSSTLNLITEPKGRIFKYRKGRRWYLNRYLVREPKHLMGFLKDYDDAYYSVSRWLYPREKKKSIADKIFLGSDLCFDFDSVQIENIFKAREFMIQNFPECKIKYLLQTSRNNFQLLYNQEQELNLNNFKEKRNKLIERLKKENIICDYNILNDIHRVIRIPFSVHHSKFQTRVITFEELKNIKIDTNPKPKREDYSALYLPNKVGKNKYIFFVKNVSIYTIKKVQSAYRLGNIYSYLLDNDVYCISLKILSKRRLEKALRYIGRRMKYDRSYCRVSKKRLLDGTLIGTGIKPLGILKSDARGHYSKPHAAFLMKQGFEVEEKDLSGTCPILKTEVR